MKCATRSLTLWLVYIRGHTEEVAVDRPGGTSVLRFSWCNENENDFVLLTAGIPTWMSLWAKILVYMVRG